MIFRLCLSNATSLERMLLHVHFQTFVGYLHTHPNLVALKILQTNENFLKIGDQQRIAYFAT